MDWSTFSLRNAVPGMKLGEEIGYSTDHIKDPNQ